MNIENNLAKVCFVSFTYIDRHQPLTTLIYSQVSSSPDDQLYCWILYFLTFTLCAWRVENVNNKLFSTLQFADVLTGPLS